MDYFDWIPDPLILQIFNSVSDVKTLARCRAVSRRFSSLVPQSDSLLLRVDRVVSESDLDSLLLLSFLKTLFKSLLSTFLSPKAFALPSSDNDSAPNSPARILRGFDRIRELDIELPAGDLRLEKGTVVRYKAAFGASLKSCVILGFSGEGGGGFTEGLRERVAWVISALITASARHAYVAREVVGQHGNLVRLVVRDREGEGEVTMDARGIEECRQAVAESGALEGSRTAPMVPSVRMRMRHLKMAEIGPGVCLEGATLVVVRPSGSHGECGDNVEDADLAMEAFGGGVYGNAVEALLRSRSHMLEMNSL
ncbi:F-box protein At1g22220-like [Punica granatum]|uniref:F-box domain-containing protein n=2 Tax=Punica granatum TaxID=22663 RepID=A0A218X5D3_PUNGR|nr:F-box protein At1g22220-like [Punica granatum]OWM79939.1 hypothetical protein CDL15_Pgr006243 [Punica granatum]PKI73891.1 hypothetical protein CRG98_005761 [Punica granatum]